MTASSAAMSFCLPASLSLYEFLKILFQCSLIIGLFFSSPIFFHIWTVRVFPWYDSLQLTGHLTSSNYFGKGCVLGSVCLGVRMHTSDLWGGGGVDMHVRMGQAGVGGVVVVFLRSLMLCFSGAIPARRVQPRSSSHDCPVSSPAILGHSPSF